MWIPYFYTIVCRKAASGRLSVYLVIHGPLDHFKLVSEYKLTDVFFGTVR